MKAVRCAIYTRKSSDEGLDQAFNSLDAQREACAAYILSQASEGWTALPEIYDDGGISGGTLERPALKRLLADVAAGRIDIIVVYKVDRLSRSLFDFAKLVELFEKAGTSFVSVTQSFNTTTSMGRLTLNMLLSFAQFEREVTAERIRDKIAASKAKGMWMGGTPPLGYEPDGRSLKIVEDHARIVRDIFDRYLRLGNVRSVAAELERANIRLPVRRSLTRDRSFGGGSFMRGQLYTILKCPTYIGEVHHRGQIYPALHEAIIDRATWDAVQTLLASNVQGNRSGTRAKQPSLLAGKVVDADGAPLLAVHATKGSNRYRYYVSHAMHHGTGTGMRIPAVELEGAVREHVAQLFDDGLTLATTAALRIDAHDIGELINRSKVAAVAIRGRDRPMLLDLIAQVRIHDGRIEIDLRHAAIVAATQATGEDDAPVLITITAGVRLTRSGRVMRLIQGDGLSSTTAPDGKLIRLVARAHRWWRELRSGALSVTELATREGVQNSYITRVVRLAFLSPAVVEAILAGRTKSEVTGTALTLKVDIAADWAAQRAAFLPVGYV